MASPPTSPSVRFISREGGIIPAPPEWAACRVEVDVDSDKWGDLTLLRNGVALPLALTNVGGERRIVAEWPRSGAGSYVLNLSHPDWAHPERCTCTIEPEKLSPDAYRRLLDDLQRRLPATIAIALQE